MTRVEIHNAIRARFKAQVATPQSLTTVYDNDPTSPPTDDSIWCRLTIKGGYANRRTVGVKSYRYTGVAFAQLFGPVGRGDGALLAMADAIVAAFQDETAASVTYLTVEINNVGPDGNVYQINVEVPYRAYHQD